MGPCYNALIPAIGLVVYDYLLNVPSEVKYVWQRKLNVASILLIIVRYTTLFQVATFSPSLVPWYNVTQWKANSVSNLRKVASVSRLVLTSLEDACTFTCSNSV